MVLRNLTSMNFCQQLKASLCISLDIVQITLFTCLWGLLCVLVARLCSHNGSPSLNAERKLLKRDYFVHFSTCLCGYVCIQDHKYSAYI